MRKFMLVAVVAGLGALGATSALALTPAPLARAHPGLTIRVAGGCGIGFHRGPRGGCRRNRGPVVVVPGAVVVAPGPCGGRGRHRVCGPRGCRMVCN